MENIDDMLVKFKRQQGHWNTSNGSVLETVSASPAFNDFKKVLNGSGDKYAPWFPNTRQKRALCKAEESVKMIKRSKDNCNKSLKVKTSHVFGGKRLTKF